MTRPSPKPLLFGTPVDPRLIANVLFGAAPAQLLLQPTATPAVGGVIFPVPGRPGEQGLPGNAATSYTHMQSAPASTWTIAHNLGFQPTTQARSVSGSVIDVEVLHLSENVLEIHLTLPIAGSAHLT